MRHPIFNTTIPVSAKALAKKQGFAGGGALFAGVLFLAWLAFAQGSLAQEGEVDAGGGGEATVAEGAVGSAAGAGFGLPGLWSPGLPELEPPQPLPTGVTFHFGAGMMYDDNIYRLPENEESAMALQADAGLSWNREQSGILATTFAYRIQGATYLDLDSQNSVDQFLEASAGLNLPRTRFGFSMNYAYLTGASQNFGRGGRSKRRLAVEQAQIDDDENEIRPLENRHQFDTSLEVERKLAERTGMTAGIHYGWRGYEEADRQSSHSITGRLEAHYAATDFTRFGLAGEITTRSTERTADITTERLLLTARRMVNERVDFSGEAGVSFRQYGGANAVGGDTGFVFRLNYTQRVGAKTAFNLSASRDMGGSASTRGAGVERTRFSASVSHQLAQRVSLGFHGGYGFSSYESTRTSDRGVDREEDFWQGGISLSYSPTASTAVSVYYNYRYQDSSSGTRGLVYDSNQIGVRAGISF